jgi:hypothetical protein
MSNYVKLATDAGDQYLAALAEAQENFLKASSAFTARFAATTPPVEIPAAFTATFPTPAEVTEASFSFAQKLLKQQKSFTEKLLAASAPASVK